MHVYVHNTGCTATVMCPPTEQSIEKFWIGTFPVEFLPALWLATLFDWIMERR